MTAVSSSARKVLLIGAYANGNLGDMYQAEAIADELSAVDPTLAIFSTSPSKRAAAYPARNHSAVGSAILYDHEKLNEYDMIFVGGGGLLAAQHAPLHDPVWVGGIKVPLFAVSLGAAGTAPAEARAFIEKCSRFSARDEFSAEHIKPFRSSFDIVMDPILLGPARDLRNQDGEDQRNGILWVPGKLVDSTIGYYAELFRNLYSSKSDEIVSFNPETDKASGFSALFGEDAKYLDGFSSFFERNNSKRMCVSERYHGCIASIKMGVPTVGLVLRSETVTSKISEMFRKLGLSKLLVDGSKPLSRGKLRDLTAQFDIDAIRQKLSDEKQKLSQFLRSCLEVAGAVPGQPDAERNSVVAL